LAAISLALGSMAYRSWKAEGETIFDVSVWGEKTKTVLADEIDLVRNRMARLAGTFVLDEQNEVIAVMADSELEVGEESLRNLEKATSDESGWSGRIAGENPLQSA